MVKLTNSELKNRLQSSNFKQHTLMKFAREKFVLTHENIRDNMNSHEVLSSMPKAELHAHLNGSINLTTIKKLIDLKVEGGNNDEFLSVMLEIENGCNKHQKSLDECFQVFKTIHKLTDSADAIYLATVDVIKDFADDSVYYLELRTTPRFLEGSLSSYVDAVLKGIDDCNQRELPIDVKLLLSIDRSQGLDFARRVVELTIDYGQKRNDVIVGLDVSGNMTNSNLIDYFPLLEKIKNAGLRLTVHTAEIQNDEETEAVLRLKPNRIGHGTFISPSLNGGNCNLFELLKESKIPVEVCLTSNIISKTVPSFEDHHLKDLMEHKIPFSICTDDKGVFGTSLSQEYVIACETFNLSIEDMWNISSKSLDYAFITAQEKENLMQKWTDWKRKMLPSN